MCRKNHLQGCCLAAFGFGVMIGHSIESWLLCLLAGIGLITLGCLILKQR